MSTSILPIHTLSDETPRQPAPRRTYGRARPRSPSPNENLPSLFAPLPKHVSPSKALLNRFSTNNNNFLGSLEDLDVPSSDAAVSSEADGPVPRRKEIRAGLTSFEMPEDAEEDINPEEAKAVMERMRRELRGETMPKSKAVERPPATVERLIVPSRKLGAFTSSSLTELPPTTQPRSSPPPPAKPTAELTAELSSGGPEEETMPVRTVRNTGRSRKLLIESEEEDDEEDDRPFPSTLHRKSSPPPSSPPITQLSTTDPDSDQESSTRSSSPTPRISRKAARRSSSPSGSAGGDEDDAPIAPRDTVGDFMAEMAKENEREAERERQAQKVKKASQTSAEVVGLFDDDDGQAGPRDKEKKKKARPIKNISKKDRDLALRDVARMGRERDPHLSKNFGPKFPMSHFVMNAAQAIAAKAKSDVIGAFPPPLTSGGSPPTSPIQSTPHSPIHAFTPSSLSRHPSKLDPTSSKLSAIDPPSSPTRTTLTAAEVFARREKEIMADDEEEDETLPVFDIAEESLRITKQQQTDLARQKLDEQKSKAIKDAARKKVIKEQVQNQEDDLYIESPIKPKTVVRLSKPMMARKGPDAKAILDYNTSSSVPGYSRNTLKFLSHAGVPARPPSKTTATETYVAFAGTRFDHSGMKNQQGGARPVGLKVGREVPISQNDMDGLMRRGHAEQAMRERERKEGIFGTGRRMPEKKGLDVEGMVVRVEEMERRREEMGDEEGEEGDEDEDWVPEDEEVEEEGAGEIVYSGEEDEAVEEEQVDEQAVQDEEIDHDAAELIATEGEEEEEDMVIPIRRQYKATARFVDSDDEREESLEGKTARDKGKELAIPRQRTPEQAIQIDLAGFGSGGGSPGFSQLFEATQLGTGPVATSQGDGFASLRDRAPMALLPAHAMLPGVNISNTQARRDDALIAAEVDAAMDIAPVSPVKPKYLNDEGFFTQTKPVFVPAPTYQTDEDSQFPLRRSNLAGDSMTSIDLPLIPTSTDHSPVQIPLPQLPSPTQGEETLTRLKRRESSQIHEIIPNTSSPRAPSPTPVAPAKKDTFSRMMLASRRQERREALKSANLLDEQAEESDEDNGWGRLGGDDDDEGEEGEDEGFVKDLVDDQVVEDEERSKQDELVAQKAREVAAADDAKREAEARKVIEGEHRMKRRGRGFLSDDEGDGEDDERRKQRMAKKQRKQRKLDMKDGLSKLKEEERPFLKVYEDDVASDDEEIEEYVGDDTLGLGEMETMEKEDSPDEMEGMSYMEKHKMLQARGKQNRDVEPEDEEEMLDREIGYTAAGFRTKSFSTQVDDDDFAMGEVEEEESQYSISKTLRNPSMTGIPGNEDISVHPSRRLSSFSKSEDYHKNYVQEEQSLNRRSMAAGAGASVVTGSRSSMGHGAGQRSNSGSLAKGGMKPPPARQGSGSSASILGSRMDKFAR